MNDENDDEVTLQYWSSFILYYKGFYDISGNMVDS